MPKQRSEKQSALSEEIVRDSSDEDENEPVNRKPNGVINKSSKRHQSRSESENDSNRDRGSDDESTPGRTSRSSSASTSANRSEPDEGSQAAINEDAQQRELSNGIESDSDESASSESSRKRRREEDDQNRQPAKKHKSRWVAIQKCFSDCLPVSSDNISRRTTENPYQPPDEFVPLVLGPSDFASDVPAMFANLEGKQIWHISAPASLNISSVKELDLAAATRGDPILSERGISYRMQETTSKNDMLMLSEGRSAQYKTSKGTISRSFTLGVGAGISKGSETSKNRQEDSSQRALTSFAAQSPGERQHPRRQPEGLHKRYQPFGTDVVKARPLSSTMHKQKPLKSKLPPSEEVIIEDPMLGALASLRRSIRYEPKAMVFSTPAVKSTDRDVEMEEAPTLGKAGTTTVDVPSSSPQKIASPEKTGSPSKTNGQQKVKKKSRSRSKLVDGQTL
jgi:hypothetical protein